MADCARFMRRAAAAKLPSATTASKTTNWSSVRASIHSDYLNEMIETISIYFETPRGHFWTEFRESIHRDPRSTMTDTKTAPYAALLLRFTLGVLFLAHAGLKIFVFTPAGTAQFFESIGLPGVLAYITIVWEVVGALAMILGIWP